MDDALIPALNARLTEMGGAAAGAERSLEAACRALKQIQLLCETQLPDDPSEDELSKAKTSAARADVSLNAIAGEIDRVAEALRLVAGLDD
jgi:hypothetical protein